MAHWLIVDATSFEVATLGSAPGESYPPAPPGHKLIPVSSEVLRVSWAPEEGPIDLDALKAALCRQIDVACGDMRRRFVTDITGQDATYQLKLAEARRWQSGDDPADYAYLGREAAKRGVTLAALVAEVLATAALWIETIDPELESSRVAAKKQVLAATSAAQIIAAAQVDWEALLP